MFTRKMILAMSILILTAAAAPWASAAVIYVDVDANGNDDGTSWTDAFNDLQDGLADPNSGDEIWVAEGTYKPTDGNDRTISFDLVSGVALYAGFDATETARDQRDWINNLTTLSGDIDGDDVLDSNNSYNVVCATDCNVTVVLDGFTVTMGYADSYPWQSGGGMDTRYSTTNIANCIFTENGAVVGGGMLNSQSTITVTDCTFSDNVANSGAGIFDSCLLASTISNCLFTGNSASLAGGMRNDYCPGLTVKNCIFSKNSALNGGGLVNGGSLGGLANCIFTENSATSYGGAVFNTALLSGETVSISSCLFVLNDANCGGGIFSRDESGGSFTIDVTNCTLSENDANYGGGIYSWSADPTVTNCIFWQNHTPDDANNGGEIYNYDDAADPNFSFCDIEGGINGAKCGGYDSVDGGNNIDSDPCFVDADSNDYHLIDANSPCFNTGDPDGDYSGQFDIDGDDRVMDANVDIGADEIACMGYDHTDYDDWVMLGKPECWCYRRQCRGDIDGVKTGPFWVALPDLNIFKDCFNQFELPPGCECADLDHQPTGPFRVGIPDQTIFKEYFNETEPNVPVCDDTYINFWVEP